MSLAIYLVDALKASLKRRGRTYAEVAAALGVSEATVKRDLSKRTLGIDRFAQICEAIGVTLEELTEQIESRSALTEALTYEQEQQIVSDPRLWLVSLCALNHWSFDEIHERYDIAKPELTQHLLALDAMGILELHGENRIRLRLARNFRWLRDGPFIKTFRDRLAKEFFEGAFDDQQEQFRLVAASLSQSAKQLVLARMRQLAEEIATLHVKDQRVPRKDKSNVTCVIALRDWEPQVFQALQR
ncbi:MAG: helix-turn-helix domain-containing protein [Casimicrobium sp.]